MTEPSPPLIELRGVSKRFARSLDLAEKIARRLGASVREEVVHAVTEIDLVVRHREVVGLVGESGCGKSTLGRVVAGIIKPNTNNIRALILQYSTKHKHKLQICSSSLCF